ncbi:MAG: hypothetical protein M3R72_04540 [Bacteroidota bacterium]|nr:hypothetical protein [Bacteroidota bacterium]
MKKLLFVFASFLLFTGVFAQIKNPVHWTFSAKKINATTYEVHVTANMDGGWHIYSQTTPAGGPVPTSISFTKNPLLIINDTPKEVGKLESHHEPLFGVDVKQFSNGVDFVQTVKVKGKVKTKVDGNIKFMSCNDNECLPPKNQPFSVSLQ